MQATLSVIIITKNEERRIRDCLESVKWADEIIILDSGSEDKTCEIAREYTKHVYRMDWPGYGKQKQRALDKASGDWVLSIDADERVSKELQLTILDILNYSKYDGYKIKIPLVFYGKVIRFANGGSYHTRLFKKAKAAFSLAQIHEDVHIKGNVGKLKQPIFHYSCESLSHNLDKLNYYTSLSAKSNLHTKKKTSLFRAIIGSVWMFFKVYVLKFGFLDGKDGFVLSVAFAEGCFYRYVKLMYLRKRQNHNEMP